MLLAFALKVHPICLAGDDVSLSFQYPDAPLGMGESSTTNPPSDENAPSDFSATECFLRIGKE